MTFKILYQFSTQGKFEDLTVSRLRAVLTYTEKCSANIYDIVF